MEGGEAGVVAVTKVFAIRVRLDDRVRYITDGEKTSLASSIAYISNPEKTEQFFFTSALNCSSVDTALSEMMETKQQFGKMGGVLGYHFIQSFQPGEVTPEQAHAIGLEFAKRLFGKRYEVVISTHLNKHHLHNHLVVNSVSCVDGQKYPYYTREDCAMDAESVSYMLCRNFGVETPQPDVSRVGQVFDGMEVQDRRGVVDSLQKYFRKLQNDIQREISPQERKQPEQNRPVR